ncbi:mCG146265, partial [Mus musculus]
FCTLAPEDVSNKVFAAEDSGLLCSSWPVVRTRVRIPFMPASLSCFLLIVSPVTPLFPSLAISFLISLHFLLHLRVSDRLSNTLNSSFAMCPVFLPNWSAGHLELGRICC